MNSKHFLIATLFAAASAGAFAADEASSRAVNANAVVASEEIQLAQASVAARGMTSRTGTVAAPARSSCPSTFFEISATLACMPTVTRSRAEVRAETLDWLAKSGNRVNSQYAGTAY
jgi:hypothetical protein